MKLKRFYVQDVPTGGRKAGRHDRTYWRGTLADGRTVWIGSTVHGDSQYDKKPFDQRSTNWQARTTDGTLVGRAYYRSLADLKKDLF